MQHTLNNKDVHGRVARKNNLNTKLSVWSMQNKTLRSFVEQCAGETKIVLLATTKEGMFGEKRVKPL